MHTILVCDDDKDIVNALGIYLRAENYKVLESFNGQEALDIVSKENVDLVLMDIMMPEMDGITAMSKIRDISIVPVIFLTAKGEDTDKVIGLNVGADDYVTKPFNPIELLARVRSVLRRYHAYKGMDASSSVIKVNDITLDDDAKEVKVSGDLVRLTPTEYEILKLLMMNAGKVYSIQGIYEAIWNDEAMGAEGSIPVHIRHLREKIEIDPANPRYLKVVWGQGYRIEKEIY